MTRKLRIATFASVLLIVFTACRSPAETTAVGVPSLDGDFARSTLFIEADDGLRHEFDVYLAVNNEQQRRGLMYVRRLPVNMGMLFVYEDTDMHSMWMKNTYISLDMVFARSDGSVSSVIHDTEPLSLKSQSSREAVNYVLELNAGTARRLNIGRKSRIIVAPEDAVEK